MALTLTNPSPRRIKIILSLPGGSSKRLPSGGFGLCQSRNRIHVGEFEFQLKHTHEEDTTGSIETKEAGNSQEQLDAFMKKYDNEKLARASKTA